ncbi:MAG TPA: hypothetical protein DCS07_01115 [Bdellovibrionales bacterium]|nr:MAG: hypothetical protein A2Z97_03690 [Bdellovibrionales bacterium GWB1_52_6]OFZ02956.1 MAG: hypothetical protein A2X97_05120 [Bdellovibrionales bacterium GWA1_52_35]OFZ33706.1 MAG: hypothetical protein A2070_15035 [Bdellovibrionales bacterium GWC1_52_8]HAR41226.1 hypothetical protein [Bdellovibrionales bacterium]HCM38541.1 hypothetical protein [Bdellovibrionales bacterium]
MDRRLLDLLTSLNRTKLLGIAGVAAIAIGTGFYTTRGHSAPATQAKTETHAAVAPAETKKLWARIGEWLSVSDLVDTYGQAFVSVQDKMNALRRAEEQNRRLSLENAHLKVKLETSRYSCRSEKAAEQTEKLQMKLSKETGSRVGRNLASINYSPPSNLLPSQLYTLGISYFKTREDEKAAVIFTFLTGLEDVSTYKTAPHWLTTGIAWYRLDNYELADQYFEYVLKTPETPEILKFQAQARLWKALTASRQGKQMKAQYWVRDLIDHHPHSKEAKWVNSKEVERATASVHHSATPKE